MVLERGYSRGGNPASSAIAVVSALKFTAFKLGLPGIDEGTIKSLLWILGFHQGSGTKGSSGKLRHSPFLQLSNQNLLWPLRGVICRSLDLPYSWCLRWSDAQRLQFSSLHLDSESVLEGMPFGVLCWDAVGVSWAAYFGRYLMVCRRLDPERDF